MNEQELKTLGERYVRDVFDDRFCRSFAHYGIKGQKHGVRRFQNEDGSLTPEGERRYLVGDDNRQAAARNPASPFTNTRLGTKRTEQPAAGQREKVAVAAETAQRVNQSQDDPSQRRLRIEEADDRLKEALDDPENEPETKNAFLDLEKNGFDFSQFDNSAFGGRSGKEVALQMTDWAVYNLKEGLNDEDIAAKINKTFETNIDADSDIIKSARKHLGMEQHSYHQSQETTDKNGNTVVKVSQAIADQNKAGTPVKAVPVQAEQSENEQRVRRLLVTAGRR